MEQQAVGHPAAASPPSFTALELAAAEQLIHLSGSSGSARSPGSFASAASAGSSSSVNNVVHAEGDGDDEDEQEVGGRPRRNKRYRPIAEIYAAAAAPAGARRRKDGGAREGRKN